MTSKQNPLRLVQALGQSVWLDYIRRSMLCTGGELQELVERDGVSGVTSNPAIFAKVITGSSDYDDAIRELAHQKTSVQELYEALAVEDVGRAADLLRGVYDDSRGADGFVSIEVSPHLAQDTERTVAEARRLWKILGRPNVMIKVPGTREGLPAIRTLLAEGINVNVTLLFAVSRYEEVAEQYLLALEDRLRKRETVDHIASVASFFLSRIDSFLDPLLARTSRGAGLVGQIGLANAKVAYAAFRGICSSKRWKALARQGARPQRLLWASTSTKNPAYSDTMYVDPLVGPDTVNTMPLETIEAYRDHGAPAARIKRGLAKAREALARLEEAGIDLDAATAQLETEGLRKFAEPFDELLESLATKRQTVGGLT